MLKAPNYCSLRHPSRVNVLWSFISAEFSKEIWGVNTYRNTQMCEQREVFIFHQGFCRVRGNKGCHVPSWSRLSHLSRVVKTGFCHKGSRSRAPFRREGRGNGHVLDGSLRESGTPFRELGMIAIAGRSFLFSLGVTDICHPSPPFCITSRMVTPGLVVWRSRHSPDR